MDAWIAAHWSDFIYWLFILVVTSIGGKIIAELKHTRNDFSYTKNGTIAMLHDRIYVGCNHCIQQGWCTVDDLENMEIMYVSYHELGGNGTGTALYERMKNLPLKNKEEK